MMRVFIDQRVEEIADRAVDIAVVLAALIGVAGLVVVDGYVPLQVNEDGFTSFVPALVAAIVYPACGLLGRSLHTSSAPWIRWLGRTVVYFLVVFQGLAYASVA